MVKKKSKFGWFESTFFVLLIALSVFILMLLFVPSGNSFYDIVHIVAIYGIGLSGSGLIIYIISLFASRRSRKKFLRMVSF